MTSASPWSRRLWERMPALGRIVERVRERQPFRGRVLLLIQHQLQDELAQVEAFVELGLQLEDLHWIDIPYTSRRVIRDELVRMGVPRENFWNHDLPPLGNYETYQVPRVRRWIEERWEEVCGGRPLIVLDDGGYFLRAHAVRPGGRTVSVVEQTLRGVKVVRQDPAASRCLSTVPLINVGESLIKKTIESPAIAEAVLEGLEEDFRELAADPWREDWLIVGWGSVGSEVGRLLRARKPASQIAVWDIDSERRDRAATRSHPIHHPGDVRPFGVVIGATGVPSFDHQLFASLRDGAFLASVSSASVEFSRDQLLSGEDRFQLLNRDQVRDLHSHLVFAHADRRRFTLLNGGFPVNFDRDVVDRIPPEEIQFTSALMVHAAVRATEVGQPGIQEIDSEISDYFFEAAKKK